MDIVKSTWRFQDRVEEGAKRLSKGKLARIIKMARKPKPEEYKKTCMITAVGIVAIGALGFTVYYIWTYLPPWVMEQLHRLGVTLIS